jgi:hypothetical protein
MVLAPGIRAAAFRGSGAPAANEYTAVVRRLFAWMAGLVGIAALARVLARRSRHEAPSASSEAAAPASDPAEELRRKLSATRATPDEPPDSQDIAPPAAPDETLEERRSRVHAKAQEAIEAMQDPAS